MLKSISNSNRGWRINRLYECSLGSFNSTFPPLISHLGGNLVDTTDSHHKGELGLCGHVEVTCLLSFPLKPNQKRGFSFSLKRTPNTGSIQYFQYSANVAIFLVAPTELRTVVNVGIAVIFGQIQILIPCGPVPSS